MSEYVEVILAMDEKKRDAMLFHALLTVRINHRLLQEIHSFVSGFEPADSVAHFAEIQRDELLRIYKEFEGPTDEQIRKSGLPPNPTTEG